MCDLLNAMKGTPGACRWVVRIERAVPFSSSLSMMSVSIPGGTRHRPTIWSTPKGARNPRELAFNNAGEAVPCTWLFCESVVDHCALVGLMDQVCASGKSRLSRLSLQPEWDFLQLVRTSEKTRLSLNQQRRLTRPRTSFAT